jgi:hypothetical protein
MSSFGTAREKSAPVSSGSVSIEELISSTLPEHMLAAAAHIHLTEDIALALLTRRDLSADAIEVLARNSAVIQHRKVLAQIIRHPHTSRHVALPLLRRLFVFELMGIVLTPEVAADLKLVAEGLLIAKLETVSLGEAISLARRASAGVAGALLLNPDRAIIEAALQNPRMTEANIVKALSAKEVPVLLITMLSEDPKWSLRREIQVAILRRPEAVEAVVRKIADKLPRPMIYEILNSIRLPHRREELLRSLLER